MPTIAPFEVTNQLVQPITQAFNSALDTMVPVGIGIMATFIGISVIKRVVYTFL